MLLHAPAHLSLLVPLVHALVDAEEAVAEQEAEEATDVGDEAVKVVDDVLLLDALFGGRVEECVRHDPGVRKLISTRLIEFMHAYV